jgi:4-hydroxy-3-polyprenylbenzoate decarboxylase
LAHDFPVLQVDRVYHRPGAVWPFTVVGRPPQEDTVFGELIHELTGPAIPSVVPGVHAVHAVDAAGVHPLMLAIGSERYTPHTPLEQPQELLTQAHAILGQGQMSLAKYLLMLDRHDVPGLKINDIADFLAQWLRRVDWRRDLHFHTCTTMDTLDYSSGTLNQGSKLVIPAVGPEKRVLPTELPTNLQLPHGFTQPRVCCPGVLAVNAPASHSASPYRAALASFCEGFRGTDTINQMPLIVLCDDSDFVSQNLANFLWVTFTRSDPAVDTAGIGAFAQDKHWGCDGSLVIDARIKPHHAPPLIEDPETTRKVDALAARGRAISRYL